MHPIPGLGLRASSRLRFSIHGFYNHECSLEEAESGTEGQ